MATWTSPTTQLPFRLAGRSSSPAGRFTIPAEWVLSAHELAMGRPTLQLARSLMVSENFAPEIIATRQLDALRSLIGLARSQSPYYQRIGLPASDQITSLHDVTHLPMLDRAILRSHASELCARPSGGRRLIDHSSGSTGPAVPYYWDRLRQAWDKANRIRGHAWLGFAARDRELHIWPVDAARTRGAQLREELRQRRDALIGDLLIDSNGDAPASTTWHRWRQFDPARLTAFPSRLCEIIQTARRQGCRMFSPSLRCVFLTGEMSHDWQKSLIERELGVATAQCYGVQEAGAIAFTCEQGAWHLCAESMIVEFIRDGRPAIPGEFAEVVVTSLVNRTMPLIRYRTGDLVRMRDAQACQCARGLPTMPPVIGRFGDFIVSNVGEWIEPAHVVRQIAAVLQSGSFQVVQSSSGRIEIHVVEGPQPRSDWREAVTQSMAAMVGREVPITIRRVTQLARCPSGKMRYVQSQLSLDAASA